MKFTLKGFFSIMLLIAATGWVAQSVADTGSSGCGSCNNSCDCYDVCDLNCCDSLLTNSDNVACTVFGKTYYAARSQGDNSARKMMGVEDKIHRFGSEGFYGVASLAVEYQAAFRNLQQVGDWYSTNGGPNMTYGQQDTVAQNGTFDINGLYFGVTGSGTLSFCPSKSDVIVDINLYFGLDELFCGLWARLDIPIVHTSWNLGLREVQLAAGGETLPYDLFYEGYIDSPFYNSDTPMSDALKGGKDSAFGDVTALNKGKICGKRTDTNVAGLRFDLGYDFIRRQCWHVAASLDFVAPLGTTPNADYLFQPLVGDSKRAQIGGTFNFMYELWNNCDATHNFTFYLDLTATALLAKTMQRLPNLKIPNATVAEEVWSQYLLLKKFTLSGSTYTYDNVVERAANVLAGNMKVGASAIIDLAFMLQYNCNCFFAGLGYEFWMRTQEQLKQSCINIPGNTYAQMGAQNVVTYAGLVDPEATINSYSANNGSGVAVAEGDFITNNSISYCPALHPSVNTNKIFGFVGYNWTDCDWQPFALVGGEVEFAQSNRMFSQWGVLVKGGISF